MPKHNDQELFKWLVLESFHVGLSWRIILSKMAHFEAAFDAFDYQVIAQYDQDKVDQLLQDKGIIRHRGKIEATVANAQALQRVQAEFGSFDAYIWSFTQQQVVYLKGADIPAKSALSDKVAQDMKKRGFKFLGSVTVYSYLQAIGVLNDYEPGCGWRLH